MRHEYDKQSDRSQILGPIIKYAAIGFTISVVFITGTVTLERRVNTFERDVSELKAQLASKNRETRGIAATAGEQLAHTQAEAIITGPSKNTAATTNKPDTATDKSLTVNNPAVDNSNRDRPVPHAPRAHGTQPAADTPASENDSLIIAEPPAIARRGQADNATAASSHPAVDRLLTMRRHDTAETQATPASRDPGAEQAAAASDPENIEFVRRNHSDWVELQRLRHEHWLEEVELRHKNEFETRKTSHPGYYVDMFNDKHESM